MALSGHRTPEAARLYVKRTKTQRMIAAHKRAEHGPLLSIIALNVGFATVAVFLAGVCSQRGK